MAGALLHPQGLQTLLFQGVRSPHHKKLFLTTALLFALLSPAHHAFKTFFRAVLCLLGHYLQAPLIIFPFADIVRLSIRAVCREPEYSGKKVVAKGIIHITPQTEIRCGVLPSWSSCRLFLGPGCRLGACWNRLGEAVKTRKTRGKTGKK